MTPSCARTFVLAGKAAPGYFMAKLVIRLVHDVARVIRRDPAARKWLNLVFVPDFNVKVAERIYPAADLSQQLSTAGKEASGTGNMKLALNGALTIGTLDGANVEIREQVGVENFYLFGRTAEEVQAIKRAGYRPEEILQGDAELQGALDLIGSGHFSPGEPGRYEPLLSSLRSRDEYLVLADYRSYVEVEAEVSRDFGDREAWNRRAVLTVARMGFFSSDRAIREYAREIWHVSAVSVGEE
jgi:starch phosphorylase